AGKTLPMETLRQQLERRTCSLAPPVPENPYVVDPQSLTTRLEAATLLVSCVHDCCENCDDYIGSTARGFVISPDGLAVTNFHVLDISEKDLGEGGGYVVLTRDGRVRPIVEVLAANEPADVALVRLGLKEGETLPCLPLADAGRVGEAVHCVSHPVGRYFTYSKGVVTRRHMIGRRRPTPRITVTAEYARGSSGAPMVNDRGEVIGLVTTTDSVYYSERGGRQRDLQMVFRDCVPVESLRALFVGEPAPTAPPFTLRRTARPVTPATEERDEPATSRSADAAGDGDDGN
ncbi:MAG: serine protease, partial [Planctomycetota bacterium]